MRYSAFEPDDRRRTGDRRRGGRPGTEDGAKLGGGQEIMPLPQDVYQAIVDYLRAAEDVGRELGLE